MHPLRLLASSALVVVASACSSSSSGGPAGADPLGPAATPAADVSFMAIANNSAEAIAEAAFRNPVSGVEACSDELVAGCVVETCGASTTPPPALVLDPGAVSVTATPFGTDVAIALTGGYGRVVKQGGWTPGDPVELKAAGGADFPAFDVKTTIPPILSQIAFDGCASTDAAAPCALSAGGSSVSWSGAGSALVSVSISPVDASSQVSISCRYPGDAGAGKIPAEAIAKLAKGAAHRTYLTSWTVAPTLVQGTKYRAAVGAKRIFMGGGIALKTPG